MFPQYKSFESPNDEVRQIFSTIRPLYDFLQPKQLVDGILVPDVALVTGSVNFINHKLGREPVGYFLVKSTVAATLTNATSATPKTVLAVNSSANTTASLWLF